MKNIFFLVLLIFTANVQATAQAPDYLIYDSQTMELQVNPLEEYFEKYPNKRLKDSPVSSGNWRGYIATFEFKEDILILDEMITEDWGKDGEVKKISYKQYFS